MGWGGTCPQLGLGRNLPTTWTGEELAHDLDWGGGKKRADRGHTRLSRLGRVVQAETWSPRREDWIALVETKVWRPKAPKGLENGEGGVKLRLGLVFHRGERVWWLGFESNRGGEVQRKPPRGEATKGFSPMPLTKGPAFLGGRGVDLANQTATHRRSVPVSK